MIIERADKEIIIKLPARMDIDELQNFINYLQFNEITSKSKAKQTDIDKLVKQVKKERRKTRNPQIAKA